MVESLLKRKKMVLNEKKKKKKIQSVNLSMHTSASVEIPQKRKTLQVTNNFNISIEVAITLNSGCRLPLF